MSIGPTGEPGDPNDPQDKGGLKAAVVIKGGQVVVVFGTSLNFLKMSKDEAILFSHALSEAAAKL